MGTETMQAIKLSGQITPQHQLLIELPDDIPDGPAEVIILIQKPLRSVSPRSLLEFIDRLPLGRTNKRETIDKRLQQERESWS